MHLPLLETGGIHIGSLRTLLYNYLYAKQNGGDFIIRIEDTDAARTSENSIKHLRDSLNWLGITPDESPWNPGEFGPYTQSEREYLSYAQYLIDNGFAYYAFDTSEDLVKAREKWDKLDTQPPYGVHTRHEMVNGLTLSKDEVSKRIANGDSYTIRFKMPVDKTIVLNDKVKGDVEFNTSKLDDKILFKTNGLPSYHLANVVDDHLMEITHVFRGEEWLSSTPLHLLLYDAFKWDNPDFMHLALLLTPDGKKISKRNAHKHGLSVFALDYTSDEDGLIEGFKTLGYEPQALLNFLALHGWAPPESDSEVMSMDNMVDLFSIDRLTNSGAKVFLDKLNFLNADYIRKIDDDILWHWLDKTYNINVSDFDDSQKSTIMTMAKDRSILRKDLINTVSLYIDDITTYTDKSEKMVNDGAILVLGKFVDKQYDVDFSDIDAVKQFIYDIATENDVKFGKVMPTLRVALLGGKSGPDLVSSITVLGRDRTIGRIKDMIDIYG